MPKWMTRANEPVGPGDLVALSILSHMDAVGRIVAPGSDGAIQCVMVRGSKVRPGEVVSVEADQLLIRVWS